MPRPRTRQVRDRTESVVQYSPELYAAAVVAAVRLGMSPADFFDEALLDRLRKAGPQAAARRYEAAYAEFLHGYGPRPQKFEYPPEDFIPPGRAVAPRP